MQTPFRFIRGCDQIVDITSTKERVHAALAPESAFPLSLNQSSDLLFL
jgi:hypothetical protein